MNERKLILNYQRKIYNDVVIRCFASYFDPSNGKKLMETFEIIPRVFWGFATGKDDRFLYPLPDPPKSVTPEKIKEIEKQFDYSGRELSLLYHPYNGKIYGVYELVEFGGEKSERSLNTFNKDKRFVSCIGSSKRKNFEVGVEYHEHAVTHYSIEGDLWHFGKESKKFLYFHWNSSVVMFEIDENDDVDISNVMPIETDYQNRDLGIMMDMCFSVGTMISKKLGEVLLLGDFDRKKVTTYYFKRERKNNYEVKVLRNYEFDSVANSIATNKREDFGCCMTIDGKIWKLEANKSSAVEVGSLEKFMKSKNKQALNLYFSFIRHVSGPFFICHIAMIKTLIIGIHNPKYRNPLYYVCLIDINRGKNGIIVKERKCGRIIQMKVVEDRFVLVEIEKLEKVEDEMSILGSSSHEIWDIMSLRVNCELEEKINGRADFLAVRDFRQSWKDKDFFERCMMIKNLENDFFAFRRIELSNKTIFSPEYLLL